MKKDSKEINVGRLNDLIKLSHKILKILFILMIVLGIYAAIMLLKELHILPFILTFLRIMSPFFIGFFLAWLFDPIVTYLQEKGWKRIFGSALCYVVFIGFLVLIVYSLIPVLSTQINEFVSNTMPAVFDSSENIINDIFEKLGNVENLDVNSMKTELFSKLEVFATNLTSSLPEMVVNILKASFSWLGSFMIGLIIGFYLLLDFNKNSKALSFIIPVKYRKQARELLDRVNIPLRRFINGALIDMLLIFVVNSIGFSIIGLKSPLLFALFCAITNVIPYAGPYIGGAPAFVVGATQSLPIGIAVVIYIVLVQTIEGNLIQPYIMSRTTKLHPVVIILGLLVFGHFFGIMGMVLSTPILGVAKEIINYFYENYDFLHFKE